MHLFSAYVFTFHQFLQAQKLSTAHENVSLIPGGHHMENNWSPKSARLSVCKVGVRVQTYLSFKCSTLPLFGSPMQTADCKFTNTFLCVSAKLLVRCNSKGTITGCVKFIDFMSLILMQNFPVVVCHWCKMRWQNKSLSLLYLSTVCKSRQQMKNVNELR